MYMCTYLYSVGLAVGACEESGVSALLCASLTNTRCTVCWGATHPGHRHAKYLVLPTVLKNTCVTESRSANCDYPNVKKVI